MLEFDDLAQRVHLNKSRLATIAYKTKVCYRDGCYDEEVLRMVVRQLAVNLSWILHRYDKIDGCELLEMLRKNCIKSFERDLCPGNTNNRSRLHQIQVVKRLEAKARITYICNQMWAFVLG